MLCCLMPPVLAADIAAANTACHTPHTPLTSSAIASISGSYVLMIKLVTALLPPWNLIAALLNMHSSMAGHARKEQTA